ncbi:hypothetical protein FF38_00877, partial [Lucilia cuprina]
QHFTKVHFELSKAGTPIAHLNLAKPVVKIGDILTVKVGFLRPCLHLSAYIELKEEIFEPYAALKPEQQQQTSSCVYTCFSRQYVQTFGLKELGLYFPTLTSATSRLDTEQVRASWTLKLEFFENWLLVRWCRGGRGGDVMFVGCLGGNLGEVGSSAIAVDSASSNTSLLESIDKSSTLESNSVSAFLSTSLSALLSAKSKFSDPVILSTSDPS